MSARESNSFSPACRLRFSREFNRVRNQGKKRHTAHFIVILLEKSNGPTRLGLTVSRKVGGAVVRNRIKRLVREFFRTHYGSLPRHADLSVIAKRGAGEVDYRLVCEELSFLIRERSSSGTTCPKDSSSA